MIVWRLTRKAHAEQSLSGEGARRYGGRWNHGGVPIVYASQTLSLAVLEYLVNVSMRDLPTDLVSVQIDIPDDLPRRKISIAKLPVSWRMYPAPAQLKETGTDWVRKHSNPILIVPSAVIPGESNWLINPAHNLANKIRINQIESFRLDERLQTHSKPRHKPNRRK
jgi:RES domain-containing protein